MVLVELVIVIVGFGNGGVGNCGGGCGKSGGDSSACVIGSYCSRGCGDGRM